MEATRKRSRWTYAEFARLPSEGSTRYEVIDGEVAVTPGPSRTHQRIVAQLIALLHPFVTEHDLGEVYPAPFDVLFAEGDYFEPDLLFVRKERLEILSERGVEGAPDLVVEITSASTAARDRGIKIERYRLFGVAECWVVDPDARTIEVWDLAAGAAEPAVLRPGDTLHWSAASEGPGLGISLRDLFGESSTGSG